MDFMNEYEMQCFLFDNGMGKKFNVTREAFMEDDQYMFEGAEMIGYAWFLDEDTQSYTFYKPA